LVYLLISAYNYNLRILGISAEYKAPIEQRYLIVLYTKVNIKLTIKYGVNIKHTENKHDIVRRL